MHAHYPHIFSPVHLGLAERFIWFLIDPYGRTFKVGVKPSDDLVTYNAGGAKITWAGYQQDYNEFMQSISGESL